MYCISFASVRAGAKVVIASNEGKFTCVHHILRIHGVNLCTKKHSYARLNIFKTFRP